MLHPTKKTTYFTKVGWPTSWINKAKAIITKEWVDNYKPKAASAPSIVDPEEDDNDNSVRQLSVIFDYWTGTDVSLYLHRLCQL